MKRTLHVLTLLGLLVASAGAQTLSNYHATIVGQLPNYYYTFDGGSLTNSGTNSTVISWATSPAVFSQYTFDAFGNAYSSIFFSPTKTDLLLDSAKATDQIINSGGAGVATTESTAEGSITLLFKSLDPGSFTAQKYIFSAGIVNSNHNSCSLLFQNTNASLGSVSNALVLRLFDKDTTLMYYTNLVPNTWYYFALTYTEATNGYFFDGTTNVVVKAKWYLGLPGSTLATGNTTNALDCVAGETFLYLGNSPATTAGFGLPGNGLFDEFATWTRRLSDTEVQAQFDGIPSSVTPPRSQYQSVVSSQLPTHYFKMDGNYVDSVDGSLTLKTNIGTVALTYDYFGGPTNSVMFTAGADTVTNNGNLLNGGGGYNGALGTGQGSISCLVWTLASTNVGGQRFAYSAGGNTAVSNAFALFVENLTGSNPTSLKVRFGDSSSTILQASNLVTSAWYYFAMTYDESVSSNQVSWWLGQPGKSLRNGKFSAGAGSRAGNGLAFFIGNNTNYNAGWRNSGPTSSGRVDEFAIWTNKLTGVQVTNQFNALVVAPPPPPVLSVSASGGNVILSWANTNTGYALFSTTNLVTPSWVSAGSASSVGSNFVVTNSVDAEFKYYRLQK